MFQIIETLKITSRMVIPNKELGVVQGFKEVFYFLRNSVGLDSAATLLKSTFLMSVIRALLEKKQRNASVARTSVASCVIYPL